MADTFTLNTLLRPEDLQSIAQRVGSPSFYSPTTASVGSGKRELTVSIMVGRVPTPAEFYYGMYVDRVGDTLSDKALTLTEKRLGFFRIQNNGTVNEFYYAIGKNMKASPLIMPEGINLEPPEGTLVPVEPDPTSSPARTLDWSFSSSHNVRLQGFSSTLRNDLLADEKATQRPTWFYISEDPTASYVPYKGLTPDGVDDATLSCLSRTSSTKGHPLIMGTVGVLGSGADLELAEGADLPSEYLRLVSLRIGCNPVV